MGTKLNQFKAMANKARKTRDEMDIRNALRYGIENRIKNSDIRNLLR